MNSVIYGLLLLIFILNLGQAIYLTKKFEGIEGQLRGQKKALDRIEDSTEVSLRFKDEIIRGKLEEINQKTKEEFQTINQNLRVVWKEIKSINEINSSLSEVSKN